MSQSAHATVQQHSEQTAADNKTLFGFWVYLMTDCILFATLFATYAVLRGNTYGGPGGEELFKLPFVLIETLLLLTSSVTSGLALLAARRSNAQATFGWLSVTFVLGLSFISMELFEFTQLVQEGHSWRASGFLSAFFTLVATHGLHITAGLIWCLVLLRQVKMMKLRHAVVRRISLFTLFWHFLDIVWIFIFTIVYMMGAAGI